MDMTLGDIITRLEREPDKDRVVPFGWGKPCSYRGYYEDLAFAPADNVTVGSMLAHARDALGTTYYGYKGGDYRMDEYTRCWIATYGDSNGQAIGGVLLALLLGERPCAEWFDRSPVGPQEKGGERG